MQSCLGELHEINHSARLDPNTKVRGFDDDEANILECAVEML